MGSPVDILERETHREGSLIENIVLDNTSLRNKGVTLFVTSSNISILLKMKNDAVQSVMIDEKNNKIAGFLVNLAHSFVCTFA